MKNLTAKDVMLALDDYAVVPETATILEAFQALQEAQKKLAPGHHRHRAVLVVDGRGEIVGKVGHFAFLKGLEPNYGRLGDFEAVTRAGLSHEFVTSVMDHLRLWQGDAEDLCRRAKSTTVKEIMRPASVSVSEDAPLGQVIHLLILNQTLSLLVRCDTRVVGIVRLSDVFQRVFEGIRACVE
jgi:CBS domain-containing protein